jgi:hypothetical protein
MPLPVVLIDVPPEAPPPFVALLVRACSAGLRRGECRTAAESAGRVVATVSVSWSDASKTCMTLSVTSGVVVPDAQRVTHVCFDSADAPAERWRAGGFAAATLADPIASASAPSQPQSAAQTSPAQTRARVQQPGPPQQRWATRLGVALLAGPGLDDGVWRWGSRVRVSQTLDEGPLFAAAGLHWAVRGKDEPVSAQWVGGAIGLGMSADPGPFAVGLSLELLVENLRVFSTDEATGLRDAGDRWVPGFLAGIDARWPKQGPLALDLGAYAWRLRDGTTVTRFDERVASWPALGWSLAGGVEFGLD